VNDLHDLFHDAVDGIEPADRLTELRARTASPERAAARPWFWAAGATVLATAAAVAVVAVVSDGSDAPGHHHHDMAMDPSASTQLVAAYFLGDNELLYREFDEVPAGDPLRAALDRIQQPPEDPDYNSAFPPGSFSGVSLGDGTIRVDVADPEADVTGVAVQQVVYTLQAAAGERWPVEFRRLGELGPGEMVIADPAVLNPVSISDPAEGNEYAGSMIARGRVEPGGALWDLTGAIGGTVRQGAVTATTSGAGLRPWQVTVDLEGLEPGSYTFTVRTTDTSEPGKTTFHTSTDTRTITVR